MTGIVFDIKEFALNDGDGIRTTVFLKGCPLRCIWCHNPEGLSSRRELYIKPNGCLHCGLCRRPCTHPECQGLGRCLHICPRNLVGAKGEEWESAALAQKLLEHKAFFDESGGGVTLSGGEPLLQADFCVELLGQLAGKLHTAIETCGYASAENFQKVISLCDFVMMDLKLADREEHFAYTGVYNNSILSNAQFLQQSGKPHLFRVPLIPGITDTDQNLSALGEIAGTSPVELLPYNRFAGAKYQGLGKTFTTQINESQTPNANTAFFRNAVVRG